MRVILEKSLLSALVVLLLLGANCVEGRLRGRQRGSRLKEKINHVEAAEEVGHRRLWGDKISSSRGEYQYGGVGGVKSNLKEFTPMRTRIVVPAPTSPPTTPSPMTAPPTTSPPTTRPPTSAPPTTAPPTTPQPTNAPAPAPSGLAGTVFNALVNAFAPVLANSLENQINANFKSFDVGEERTETLDYTSNDGCSSPATITYSLGALSGSDVDINSLELLPGTEVIDVSFLGLNGADWGGTWLMKATSPSLQVETFVTLTAEGCEIVNRPVASGLATLNGASAELKADMFGETSNLLMFQQTSQVNTVTVDYFTYDYVSITHAPEVAMLNMGGTFESMIREKLDSPALKDQLQEGLNANLPFKP
jgi:hypothetical protein